MNNILTTILGNASLAERKARTQPEDVPGHLQHIVTASEKAAELCGQMLAYSGKGSFVIAPVNLSRLVEDITKLLEVSVSRNVELRFRLEERLPCVRADASQLQQVIMNLVLNASEAIGNENGVICIATGVMRADRSGLVAAWGEEDLPAGRYVYLEVSDTGCGMDAQVRRHIFEPFYTTKFTGRGLGMSVVQGIIRGHNGTLKLDSEPGRGTIFRVLLPATDDAEKDSMAAVASDTAWCGTGTVLVVDDDATIRETAAMMLEQMGFSVLTAADGEEGVEVYRRHMRDIGIVLLDMTMPRLDGAGCFRELRRLNADVKVVLSSGYNEQEATGRFPGEGLAGFVQKPYRPETLAAVLRVAGKGEAGTTPESGG